MRCGILIIGSLLWDKSDKRVAWRAARLKISDQMSVRAPFYYGRKSQTRGNTFTMAFAAGKPSAQGVLVPCANEIETIDDLIEEANALWQAEDTNASPEIIGKPWGCVGALFRTKTTKPKLKKGWTAHFQKTKAQSVSVIGPDGILNIPWPKTSEGHAVVFDAILATATNLNVERPTALDVADAWLAQDSGHECYFFQNVQHGIRTPDDTEIWRRIEERSPHWVESDAYKAAIKILRSTPLSD